MTDPIGSHGCLVVPLTIIFDYLVLVIWVLYDTYIYVYILYIWYKLYTHDGSMVLEYLPTNWNYLENYFRGQWIGI